MRLINPLTDMKIDRAINPPSIPLFDDFKAAAKNVSVLPTVSIIIALARVTTCSLTSALSGLPYERIVGPRCGCYSLPYCWTKHQHGIVVNHIVELHYFPKQHSDFCPCIIKQRRHHRGFGRRRISGSGGCNAANMVLLYATPK
jgi:hypothetical protein